MNNSDLFKEYLIAEEISYNDTWENEGRVMIQFNQKLKAGSSGRILVAFAEDDRLVTVYALDYVSLSNTARKEYICKVINELNSNYTFTKFYLDSENNLVVQCCVHTPNTFDAELIWNMVSNLYHVMEEQYADIMKAMWS